MDKNVIEHVVVPHNPPSTNMVQRNHFNLFAPLGGINKVGMVGYSNDFEIDNQILSLRDRVRTALSPDAAKVVFDLVSANTNIDVKAFQQINISISLDGEDIAQTFVGYLKQGESESFDVKTYFSEKRYPSTLELKDDEVLSIQYDNGNFVVEKLEQKNINDHVYFDLVIETYDEESVECNAETQSVLEGSLNEASQSMTKYVDNHVGSLRTEVYEFKDEVNTDISGLEDRASSLEDRASSLEDRASSLEDRASSLEGDMSSHESEVDEFKSDVDRFKNESLTRIDRVEKEIFGVIEVVNVDTTFSMYYFNEPYIVGKLSQISPRAVNIGETCVSILMDSAYGDAEVREDVTTDKYYAILPSDVTKYDTSGELELVFYMDSLDEEFYSFKIPVNQFFCISDIEKCMYRDKYANTSEVDNPFRNGTTDNVARVGYLLHEPGNCKEFTIQKVDNPTNVRSHGLKYIRIGHIVGMDNCTTNRNVPIERLPSGKYVVPEGTKYYIKFPVDIKWGSNVLVKAQVLTVLPPSEPTFEKFDIIKFDGSTTTSLIGGRKDLNTEVTPVDDATHVSLCLEPYTGVTTEKIAISNVRVIPHINRIGKIPGLIEDDHLQEIVIPDKISDSPMFFDTSSYIDFQARIFYGYDRQNKKYISIDLAEYFPENISNIVLDENTVISFFDSENRPIAVRLKAHYLQRGDTI